MFVPAKNLRKFVKRFNKTQDRELVSDLSREFKEELVETGILDFDNIEYRYCGRHMTNIAFSRHFQCYELLLADVVELIPTKEQEEKLRTLMKLDSGKYIWANEDEIKHCGIVEGSEQLEESIGDHTFKILEETEIKLNCIKKLKGKYPEYIMLAICLQNPQKRHKIHRISRKTIPLVVRKITSPHKM